MGGEKYSKFYNLKFQIFQPGFSLLYIVRHSIPLTVVLANARSLPTAQSQAPFAFGMRLLYGPPGLHYTIHIDSLRQAL
jgi:hypothetical protein